MRLTLRLTLFLVAIALGSFGSFGWYLLRVEVHDLEAAAEAETLLLGRALQVSTENALRDRQLEDVEETITKLRGIEPGLQVALLDPKGGVVAPVGWQRGDLRPLLKPGARKVHFEPVGFTGMLVLAQPLQADDAEPLGFVLVARPLDRLQQDVAITRSNIVTSVLLVTLAIGLLAALGGTLFIGRPLSRLMTWMRRIRETGSLLERPPLGPTITMPRDEMLTLERDFDSMVASLRDAQLRQEELERGLRKLDKLAAVGQLAAGLAHEIGSPLQILTGRAQSLVEQNVDRPEVQRQASILVSQSERISRIVQRLLSFARVRGPMMDRHDVVPLVRSVVELLEYQARKAATSVSFVSPASLFATCDADLVQQITLNLLSNALRAAGPGGTVEVVLAGDDDSVRLVVRDSGKGLDPRTKAQLFEHFFTTSAEGEGTGLGLAVVKAIVTEHGGSVEAMNRPEGGAQFTVTLPRRGRDTA